MNVKFNVNHLLEHMTEILLSSAYTHTAVMCCTYYTLLYVIPVATTVSKLVAAWYSDVSAVSCV